MSLSMTTSARLLAIHQRAFDNAGSSRSIARPRSGHGLGLTAALFIVAIVLVAFCLI